MKTLTHHFDADVLGSVGIAALRDLTNKTKGGRKRAFRQLVQLLTIGKLVTPSQNIIAVGMGADRNGTAIFIVQVAIIDGD